MRCVVCVVRGKGHDASEARSAFLPVSLLQRGAVLVEYKVLKVRMRNGRRSHRGPRQSILCVGLLGGLEC